MKRVWLVLVLALLMGDFTATSASDFTIATSAEQDTVLQALTDSVITRIFLDDQLSKCDLTLKDLREIAKSFNLILSGIFHHRIDYPGMEFVGEKKRVDYPDKKQSEETKAGNGANKDKTQGVAREPRVS